MEKETLSNYSQIYVHFDERISAIETVLTEIRDALVKPPTKPRNKK